MRQPSCTIRHVPILALSVLLSVGAAVAASAQSQEPKPMLPATPVAESDVPALDTSATGVTGSSWQGPNWGVSVTWDPAIWSVEGEFIDTDYDGVQIGTPISTVYLEAYAGFGGDAEACFADAEQELGARAGVSEVVPLTDRTLPTAEDSRGEAQLFGLTATLADGAVYRAVEYVECRTIVPGVAVLEITWQTATGAFNEDFTQVEELLAAIAIPDVSSPAATPIAASATPVA